MVYHNEMTRVQLPALLHLTRLGYLYLAEHDPLLQSRDATTNILLPVFKEAFLKLNPEATEDDFCHEVQDIRLELGQDDLGRDFFNRLQGRGKNSVYRLIDWENFRNNTLQVSLEVSCEHEGASFRPDIMIFVNGLPLSYIEVKKPNAIRDGMTGIRSEFERMERRFENQKFRKFHNITQLISFSDNMPYHTDGGYQMQGSYYASTSKSKTKFNSFKEERWSELVDDVSPLSEKILDQVLYDTNKTVLKHSPAFQTNCAETTPLNHFLTSLYHPERLKFLLRYGIVYVEEEDKDGQPLIQKHIMRYPQLFATKAIVEMLKRGEKKGVIWHTQGSGKTALAFFNVAHLKHYFSEQGKVPRFYFIVDRLDLADQAEKEFRKRGLSVRRIATKAELSGTFSEDIAVVNIQKVNEDTDLTDQSGYDLNVQNIYFIDEAHRSYNVTGSYLPNLYNADEGAIKIALTGTPLISYQEENNQKKLSQQTTREIFGDYIHKYYYHQSIEDGYTLRLMREDIAFSHQEQLNALDEALKNEVEKGSIKEKDFKAHSRYASAMLDYILHDFEEFRIRFADQTMGAMVVAHSSEQARELYRQLLERQESGESQLSGALILHDVEDKEKMKQEREAFKAGKIDILFVYSMLLTGFDAPRLKKLYLGRKIRAHNLLQTLTRVNRPYKDYRLGYVVDFADISQEFDLTNQAYIDELNREYADALDEENVFGSIFMSADEIAQHLTEAESILQAYPTENLELFDREISTIQDRKQLQELRKALENLKENYNLARLFGHEELEKRVDRSSVASLLSMVTNRLATMNLLEQGGQTTSTELLNLAMSQTQFTFFKRGEEELQLATKSMLEAQGQAARELEGNWDQTDPEWISLYEEFKRILQKVNQEMGEFTADLAYAHQKAFKDIEQQIKSLNQKNDELAKAFHHDKKYARAYRQVTETKDIETHRPVFEMMKASKKELDRRVMNNQGILAGKTYFETEATQISRQSMKELNLKVTPKVVMNFSKLITDEYIGEYEY
ncbi:DEAD/DEAH box helicase family protein [Streptococcus himalayensis]|uniref:type I site-specific deoxyribonuclease n=1 Tax=Streptococcus himalayensis TaxID=1888195 RepID=A0A917A8Q7_9STRE|nr:DEAD/DEAH box helicase family protein [Streptococcus himalayensis]GGE31293.1 DEAD/DEAH box helicase [Streptococcus himalayensis]